MLEDKLLIWKLRHGSTDAIRRIYEKYRDNLLRVAAGLLHETHDAEDVVHEVFTAFVQSTKYAQKIGNLKGYLHASVANRARNLIRHRSRHPAVPLEKVDPPCRGNRPDDWLITDEEFRRLANAMARLPYEQREVVILHLQAGLKFKQIAELQQTSVQTVQSRYRYGITKLRTLLNGEVEP